MRWLWTISTTSCVICCACIRRHVSLSIYIDEELNTLYVDIGQPLRLKTVLRPEKPGATWSIPHYC